MKNKTTQITTSWSRTEKLNSSANPISTSGGTTINNLVLSSSTNVTQNKGDFATGTAYSFSKLENVPLTGSFAGKMAAAGSLFLANGSFIGAPNLVSQHAASLASSAEVAQNKAVIAMYDKLRGDVDLSIDAFQIRQTLSMLRRPMNSIVTLANQVRKRAKVTGRPFSEAWLEYTYGWKPLVGTAYGVAGIMGESASGPKGQIFKGVGVSKQNFTGITSAVCAGYNLSGTYKIRCEDIYKCYALVVLDEASKAQKAARYTSLNPASITWELMPYSFVVDWFYDVGSYLRATESALIYKTVIKAAWGSSLQVRETSTDLNKVITVNTTGGGSVRGTYKSLAFSRSKINGTPRPTKPTSGSLSELSWSRWTSAFALLRQAFKP